MFISDQNKFIFFHIPKSAGTSIHYDLKLKYSQMTDDPLPPIHHVRVEDYLKYNQDKKDYFKFCFVRNPFDRLLSVYCDFTQNRKMGEEDKKVLLDNKMVDIETAENSLCIYKRFFYEKNKKYLSYDEYCKECTKNGELLFIKKGETFEEFCEKFLETGWSKDIHFIPQSEIICDKSDNLLVDFVGKYENLTEDLEKISKIIGININPGIWRKTNHDSYKKVYNKKTKDKIEEFFYRDLKNFNYCY